MPNNNWKASYIKQRKQDAKNPDLKAYKNQCLVGHIRIEQEKLSEDDLRCLACEKDGKSYKFRFMGRYTLPRSQAKKSRFK